MAKKIFLVFLIAVLILGIYFIWPIKTKRNLNLPSNKPQEIINYLQKQNYQVTFLDSLFLKLTSKPSKGWVYINKTKLPRYKFLLIIGSKKAHYVPFTIIPGETTYFVIKDMAKKLNYNLKNLVMAYKDLAIYKEGNFLANTYNIPIYFKERDAIDFLIKNSFKEYKKIFKNIPKDNWKKYIIIASIIQKEAANNKEMPLISSVIYNRLKKNMRLQMDGSLNYGKYSHTKITPERLKEDKSFYNTYKFKGLPKEPVCNVSKEAILAAIKPAKTNYLYFVKGKNGHIFSKEYKSHLKNIKKRKKKLKPTNQN
jgi:UPF0755 protein